MPNKALKNNATLVSEDGKILTWDLTDTSINTIEFEFEFPTLLTMLMDNMFVVASISVFVVLLIVLLIIFVISKLKKKKMLMALKKLKKIK